MKTVRILALVLTGLFSSVAAQAATLSNGGFEGSLSPWTHIGIVTNPGTETLQGGFGDNLSPTEGDNQAVLLGNGNGVGAVSFTDTKNFLLSDSTLIDASLPGTLNSFELLFDSGAAIKQDFVNVVAGETVFFDFALSTQEVSFGAFGPSNPAPDAAFLFVDGKFIQIAVATEVTPPTLLLNQEVSDGYAAFQYTFQNSGPQTIGLVMFDIANSQGNTRLFVDNFQIAAIPLPAALPLFVAALAGLGWIGRRRRLA
ncbi:MAG: VPLPA-CTERM sorting domain-containing protein [Alphaproteobacteria bacterium]